MDGQVVSAAASLAVVTPGTGYANGTMGTINFWEGIPTSPYGPVIRVAVGLNTQDGDFGGLFPDIRFFEQYGNYMAPMEPEPGFIEEGKYTDILMYETQELNAGRQPSYALLSANGDGVCMAYVMLNYMDGQDFAWVGNWARTCEEAWYHSNVMMDGHALECAYIDADNGDRPTGVAIHFPEFVDRGAGYDDDPKYYCDHAATMEFKHDIDPHEIYYWIPPRINSLGNDGYSTERTSANSSSERRSIHRSRSEKIKARNNSTRLIKSKMPTHKASDLCESKSSAGPDFVSYEEGQYCDMATKTLWPLCKSEEEGDCFDADAHDVRMIKRLGKRVVSVLASVKNYTRVTDWK